jgi:hypothetical protein
MRKPAFFVHAIVTALMAMSGATATADSLNPQPLPPGRHMPTQSDTNRAYEPPDPCSQSQMQAHGSGGGAGKIRMDTTHERKAGGEQMGARNNVHCLNPQPLPPG